MKAFIFTLIGLFSYSAHASYFYHCASLDQDHWLQSFTVEVKGESAVFNGEDTARVDHSYSPRSPRNEGSKLFKGDLASMGNGSDGYSVSVLLNKYLLAGAPWGYATQRNDGYEYYQISYKCEKSALVEQALRYKKMMGNAQFMSEGDSPWAPFYSNVKTSKNLTVPELQKILELDLNREVKTVEIEKMTIASIESIFNFYINENPYESTQEARAYRAWYKALKRDFVELHGVREGRPDSGLINVYIFGRKTNGTIVGLKTFSIET